MATCKDAAHPLDDRVKRIGYSSYAAYLKSAHWTMYKDSHPGKHCEVCGVARNCLHHKTYDTLGEEEFDDCVPLCHLHHEQVHAYLRANKLTVKKTDLALAALKDPNFDASTLPKWEPRKAKQKAVKPAIRPAKNPKPNPAKKNNRNRGNHIPNLAVLIAEASAKAMKYSEGSLIRSVSAILHLVKPKHAKRLAKAIRRGDVQDVEIYLLCNRNNPQIAKRFMIEVRPKTFAERVA